MTSPNAVLTPKEVAARMRVSSEFIRSLFEQGKLEGFRAGRHLRIFAASVDEYIASRSNRKPKPEKVVPRVQPAKVRPMEFRCLVVNPSPKKQP